MLLLKVALCKAFYITLEACPSIAHSVTILLPFVGNEAVQQQVVACLNHVINSLHQSSSSPRGKKRKLDDEGIKKEAGQLVLKQIVEIVAKLNVTQLKQDSDIISGMAKNMCKLKIMPIYLAVITLDTVMQICMCNQEQYLLMGSIIAVVLESISTIHAEILQVHKMQIFLC